VLERQTGGEVLLLGEPEPAPGQRSTRRRAPLLREAAEVERQSARLSHVCRLLVRDRAPYCPLNGVLVLLPLAATDSPEDASETASVVHHDLEVARSALQAECPRFVVLCDGERLPGFAELVRHFPETARPGAARPCWVLGQHFPLLPDLPRAELPAMIEGGVAWVADGLLPAVIARLLRIEGEAEGDWDRARVTQANAELYGFLQEGRERLLRLGRMLARAMVPEGTSPALFGGAYVAGTGADAEREQGFLQGVLRRALEQQNAVSWTEEALADDRDFRRWALLGYLALAAFAVVVAVLLVMS
jgi:hypothetical protein